MKSDKRHQGSRDVPEDLLVDQRGNGSKGGVRTSSRDGRKLRGADAAEVEDARHSDREVSSEAGSDESRSSQEEVSWIQVLHIDNLYCMILASRMIFCFSVLVIDWNRFLHSGSAACRETNISLKLQKNSSKTISILQGWGHR